MIGEMLFARIIGPKSLLPATVGELFGLQCLHLSPVSPDQRCHLRRYQVPTKELEQANQTRKILAEVNGLLELLALEDPVSGTEIADEWTTEEIGSTLEGLSREIRQLLQQKQKLAEESELLPLYAKKIEQILPYLPPSASLSGYATIGLFIRQGHENIQDLVEEQITQLTAGEVDFSGFDLDDETRVVLVIGKASAIPKITEWLRDENIPQFEWPEEIGEGHPAVALDTIRGRIQQLPARMGEVEAALKEIKERYKGQIFGWRAALTRRLAMFAIYDMVGETENLFVIQGWLAQGKREVFEKRLAEMADQQIMLEWMETPQGLRGEIPVLMENRAVAQPFERLVRLYANPRHDDIDPSGLMALFLPLFFGMILGDIAYGLILFALTLVLRKRIGSGFMGDILKIVRIGSLWAIVFGVLYGEFLGTLGHSLGLRPIWLDRAEKESLVPLLLVVIGIGAAHMVLGLILGVWRAWLVKNRTHLLERAGMLVGLVGVFALVGVFTHLIPEVFTIPAASVVVIGIALLGYSIGKAGFIVGPIEFIGVIGNILSYIRIAAVGLSSVYLAKVANDLAGYFGSLVVGVIIATLFHGLNLVIGTFSPSIHSLRLMYVEFFRKFYEGGGKVYHPFGYRGTMR